MAREPTDVRRRRRGRRERAAVDHGVPDLDAGGPAVEQDPADPVLEHRQQRPGRVPVGRVVVDGRGQLALEPGEPASRARRRRSSGRRRDDAPNTSSIAGTFGSRGRAEHGSRATRPSPARAGGDPLDAGLLAGRGRRRRTASAMPGVSMSWPVAGGDAAAGGGDELVARVLRPARRPARGWCRTGRPRGSASRRTPSASASTSRVSSAPGSRTTGLIDDISA